MSIIYCRACLRNFGCVLLMEGHGVHCVTQSVCWRPACCRVNEHTVGQVFALRGNHVYFEVNWCIVGKVCVSWHKAGHHGGTYVP